MKRLVLGLAISALQVSLFCALHNWAAQWRNETAARREAWLAQTEHVTQARVQRTELTERIGELKRHLAGKAQGTMKSTLANLVLTNKPIHLLPEERERLLAELGFNWN